jgi:hypothetical protein
MKNILKEEINQIQYLFGYKRGVVISEQTTEIDPNKAKWTLSLYKGPSYGTAAVYFETFVESGQTEAEKIKTYFDVVGQITDIDNEFEELTEQKKQFYNDYYNDKHKKVELPKAETADLGKAPQDVVDAMIKKEDEILSLVQNKGIKDALTKELNTDREKKSIGRSQNQTISFNQAQTNYAKKTYSDQNVTLRGIGVKMKKTDDDGAIYTIVGPL